MNNVKPERGFTYQVTLSSGHVEDRLSLGQSEFYPGVILNKWIVLTRGQKVDFDESTQLHTVDGVSEHDLPKTWDRATAYQKIESLDFEIYSDSDEKKRILRELSRLYEAELVLVMRLACNSIDEDYLMGIDEISDRRLDRLYETLDRLSYSVETAETTVD